MTLIRTIILIGLIIKDSLIRIKNMDLAHYIFLMQKSSVVVLLMILFMDLVVIIKTINQNLFLEFGIIIFFNHET